MLLGVTEGAPRVFLSSTIQDLGDLRSAIKFWLEDFGFEVLASEWPDFPHPLDRDAIAAALAPIEACSYYILLMGTRVGSLIEPGVSATRAEFRRARTLHGETGQPQMLHLVREEVDAGRRLGRPPEVAPPDWDITMEFLDEIKNGGDANAPNWVHRFSSFRDVVDVLRATLRISGPLRRRAVEANLLWEVVENTRELLYRFPTGITAKPGMLSKTHVPLTKANLDDVEIDYRGADSVITFRFALPRMASLSRSALEDAINSGLLLEYDPRNGASAVGRLQRCLLDLRQQLLRLEGIVASINSDSALSRDLQRSLDAAKAKRGTTISVTTAAFLHGARDAMDNVLRLNRALYCHFVGLEPGLERPTLLPASPYGEQDADKREDPNRREAITFLRLTSWPEAIVRRTLAEAGLAEIADAEEILRLDRAENEGWSLS